MRLPNREERRRYNKLHKTNLTLQDFALAFAIEGIKKGEDISWLKPYLSPDMFPHKDNWALFPNGTQAVLNVESIFLRPEKYLSDEFKNWVEANKEEIFTIFRDPEDKTRKGLVTLHYLDPSKDTEQSLTWLFDMYSDLLVWSKEANKFIEPQKEEDLHNEIANTKETIALVKQLFSEEMPGDLTLKLSEVEEKIKKHEEGEEYIINPTDWQNMDNILQTLMESYMPAEEESEEMTSDQEELDSTEGGEE